MRWHPATRRSDNETLWKVSPSSAETSSLRLDVGGPDHLAPLLGFLSDELCEVGRLARKRGAAQLGEPRLDLGIGEARIDFLVKLVHYLGWSVLGCSDAGPITRLVARHKLIHGRDVGQFVPARRGGYCEHGQFTGLDIRNR